MDGAKFCSVCGAAVPAAADTNFRSFGDATMEEPKFAKNIGENDARVAGEAAKKEPDSSPDLDWSNVIDEPHKKERRDVKSPWSATGRVDEKELYAEMTPSTDKSRTMSFIDA